MTAWSLPSPLGPLTVSLDAYGALTSLWFGHRDGRESPALDAAHPVARGLAAYFGGDLRAIESLNVAPAGTEFQRRVWATLRTIPAGSTWSYADLAERVGSVARATGAANGANPVGIVIPCHRVIGRDGSLTGYAGGLPIKRWLLQHEGALLL